MKKPIKKPTTKKSATKVAVNETTIVNPGSQDFGGLKKKKQSSTESRKNVNADPNLIQSNDLDE